MKAGDAFFPMPKSFLKEHWPTMTKDEQAVCVALVSFYDAKYECFPGDERLAKEAGIAVKNVAAAVESLISRGMITRKDIAKGCIGPKPGYANALKLGRRGNIFLQSILVHSGCWADLSQVGRALYVSMRYAACINDAAKDVLLCGYDEVDGIEIEYMEDEIKTLYKDLEWMVCDEIQAELCRLAGIHRSKFKKAQEDLVAHGLLEPLEEGGDLSDCKVRFWSETWKAMTSREKREHIRLRLAAGATTGSLLKEISKERRRTRRCTRKIEKRPRKSTDMSPLDDLESPF